jgi:hypothetical protein
VARANSQVTDTVDAALAPSACRRRVKTDPVPTAES